MHIQKYDVTMRPAFTELFVAYFANLSGDELCPPDVIRGKLIGMIEVQSARGVISVDMAFIDGNPIGFSIYQIDTPDSDWCKRPGWGFLREFYIEPPHRNRGYGKALARHAVQCLQDRGAEAIYLTSDPEALGFWAKCGFSDSDEVNPNKTQTMVMHL